MAAENETALVAKAQVKPCAVQIEEAAEPG